MQKNEMLTSALAGLIALGLQAGAPATQPMSSTNFPSAQISKPPSPTKLKLIRQFLQRIGLQERLDTGSFLERHALPGGSMWAVTPGEAITESLLDGFKIRFAALKAAYAKRRAAFQQAYEDHLNWQFTETELDEIVTFLSKPVGQHYLEGRWRMEAYSSTNTEDMEQEIVDEAVAGLKK